MKNLTVFGDSWPAGADLQNPNNDAFPALLANKLNLNLVDLSQRGTSIDHAVRAFLNTDITDSVVLFCITGYARTMYLDRDYAFEVHPMDPGMEWYYTKLYSDKLGKLNRIKNCLLVQEICKNKKIPVYFVSNWDQLPDHKLIDKTLWCSKTLIQMTGSTPISLDSDVDWSKINRKNMIRYSNHPNEAGHKLIAEELYTWISSR
jgi:hypothetical protein